MRTKVSYKKYNDYCRALFYLDQKLIKELNKRNQMFFLALVHICQFMEYTEKDLTTKHQFHKSNQKMQAIYFNKFKENPWDVGRRLPFLIEPAKEKSFANNKIDSDIENFEVPGKVDPFIEKGFLAMVMCLIISYLKIDLGNIQSVFDPDPDFGPYIPVM